MKVVLRERENSFDDKLTVDNGQSHKLIFDILTVFFHLFD